MRPEGFTRLIPTAILGLGYLVAFFYCLSMALREIPTGIAYAIWSGVCIVLVAAVAWIFQGKSLDLPAVIGMGLIIRRCAGDESLLDNCGALNLSRPGFWSS